MARTNTGFLQDNHRYEKPGDPDLSGYIIATCPCCSGETYYWLSSWEKQRDGRWIQTLAIKPREEVAPEDRPRRPRVRSTD